MVIKTEICSFSEYRIWPGRGIRFIAKDGRGFLYLNKKCASLSMRKVKAQKITWTTSWRRHNKKIKSDELVKKKRRKQQKVQRAIVGLSLEDIQNKRKEKPEVRAAQQEQALREIKERKQKVAEQKRADRKALGKDKVAAKAEQKAQVKQKKDNRGKKR